MTVSLGSGWPARAQRLADELRDRGDITDDRWHAAVATTPRHLLVPEAYEQDSAGGWIPIDMASERGLDLAYSPTTLVTTFLERAGYQDTVSSSTKPDLIVRMLETFGVEDGARFLAVGFGSGYTTALVSHRLGEKNVFAVDIDEELVEAGRERLSALGLHPTVAARDGAGGFPEHAPYDRIMATCSVPAVPWAWAKQLTPGGKVLVDFKIAMNAGNLALLTRYPDRLEGRFTSRWASFMTMRHHNQSDPAPRVSITEHETTTRPTRTPPNPWWENRIVWLLAHLYGLPRGLRLGMKLHPNSHKPTAGTVTAPDGSFAQVSLEPIGDGEWEITEGGPTPIWSAVEAAHRKWQDMGQPDWSRFGLTVTPTSHWVWLDDPEAAHRWLIQT